MRVEVSYSVTFKLTKEELHEYHELKSSSERREFLLEIADYFIDSESVDSKITILNKEAK